MKERKLANKIIKKIFILISIILILLSCGTIKEKQSNNEEKTNWSKRKIREPLEIYYWQKMKNDSIKSDMDTLYAFRFDRHHKRKGVMYKIEYKSSRWKIFSERKFKILDYIDNGFILKFQDLKKKNTSKLYFKSWVEMFLDSVGYSPVMIE